MELTKEEMRLVIEWLIDYRQTELGHPTLFSNTSALPTVIRKFKTYLEGGES